MKIKVLNLHPRELQVLQEELKNLVLYTAQNEQKKDLLSALILYENCDELFYILRDKIEQNKTVYNVQFKITHAVMILRAVQLTRERNDSEKHLATKMILSIDQQLKNLI